MSDDPAERSHAGRCQCGGRKRDARVGPARRHGVRRRHYCEHLSAKRCFGVGPAGQHLLAQGPHFRRPAQVDARVQGDEQTLRTSSISVLLDAPSHGLTEVVETIAELSDDVARPTGRRQTEQPVPLGDHDVSQALVRRLPRAGVVQ